MKLDKAIILLYVFVRFFVLDHAQNTIVIANEPSRAKTRGWRGGSIIEPCESTVQATKISSVREKCL